MTTIRSRVHGGKSSLTLRYGTRKERALLTRTSMFSWRGCNQLRLLDVDPVATAFRNPEQ